MSVPKLEKLPNRKWDSHNQKGDLAIPKPKTGSPNQKGDCVFGFFFSHAQIGLLAPIFRRSNAMAAHRLSPKNLGLPSSPPAIRRWLPSTAPPYMPRHGVRAQCCIVAVAFSPERVVVVRAGVGVVAVAPPSVVVVCRLSSVVRPVVDCCFVIVACRRPPLSSSSSPRSQALRLHLFTSHISSPAVVTSLAPRGRAAPQRWII